MRGNESLTKRKDVSCPVGKSLDLEFKIQSQHERFFPPSHYAFPSSRLLPFKRPFQCELRTLSETC
jgi:hypothetical protein